MKRTPLFSAHQRLGGKMIEFGGWEMPVYYTSIVEEHLAVRSAAGLFDIAHMGEFSVQGTGARAFLNSALTNDVGKLSTGLGQYSLLCNERGGVVDDLYLYQLAPDDYLLIVNASRVDADFAWFERLLAASPQRGAVTLQNRSNELGAIALQGRRAAEICQPVIPGPARAGTLAAEVRQLKKNQAGQFGFGPHTIWVARTGYTGEDGFEFVAAAAALEKLWDTLLQTGQPLGLKPCGLGARDTLRTEVCYPLYGHELDESTTPIEAGLGFFVALEKGEFTGRTVLAGQKANGTSRKLVAFQMSGKTAPPRPDYPICAPGSSSGPIGRVVSGTQSPSLGVGIGMGYVPPEFSRPQTDLEIEIRGRRAPARVVAKPIYRKPAPSTRSL